MAAVKKARLSPSGKFIGTPALLTDGSSGGRVFRAHGVPGTPVAIPVGAVPNTIVTVTTDGRVGYKYDLEVHFQGHMAGATGNCDWNSYYRLHSPTTGWGNWVAIGANHTLAGATTAPVNYGEFGAAAVGIVATIIFDQVDFGVGDANANWTIDSDPGLAFARIEEYTS